MKPITSKHKPDSRCRAIAYLCSLVYFASYVTRINVSVMLVRICADMGEEKSALSIVVTALTVTYGIGQLISGWLGDRVKPERLLVIGLGVTAVCNVGIFFTSSVLPMAVLWGINGLGHAMLWPPIVKILASELDDADYSYAVVRVSWGSSVATILLYLTVPLLINLISWRTVMLICASVSGTVAVLFHFCSKRIFRSGAKGEVKKQQQKKLPVPPSFLLPLVLTLIAVMLQGSLRDGVTTWMPSYLTESFGLADSSSIAITVILAVLSMASFYVFDLLYSKLIRNEAVCSIIIFALSALAAGVLYLADVISSVVLSSLMMSLIVACMHGVNLMYISVTPKRFAPLGRISTFSGVLNSCTYAGAALSTYLFAKVAETGGLGWSFNILLWGIISLCGAAISLPICFAWRRAKIPEQKEA